MLQEEFETVLACLPGYGKGVGFVRNADTARTLFMYYPERYALLLLRDAMAGKPQMPLSALKASRYARLLEKPRVKALLATCGGRSLSAAALDQADGDAQARCYALTLGQWGSHRWRDKAWQQTSRHGVNLVLQVNFTGRHEALLRRHLKTDKSFRLFECASHPAARCGRHTLGWARLDIDLDAGEVLIEEVQNDWLRRAVRAAQNHYPGAGDQGLALCGAHGGRQGLKAYMEATLQPLLKVWDETILSAALWFIRHELGIGRMFYHTAASGALLKNIRYSQPPVSLYTDLPRRFCFEETAELPAMLKKDRQAMRVWQRARGLRMHCLCF